jgi:hypothetical protein
VCIIDRELLRRSWYFDYLARQYPWLVERSRREIGQYRVYLDEFEHNRLRDPEAIQRCYVAMLRSLLSRSPERTGYTTFDAGEGMDARQMLAGFNCLPVGLLYELRTDSVLPVFDYSRFRVRLPARGLDSRTRLNLDVYRFFVSRRVGALAAVGRAGEAQELTRWYESLPLSRLAPLLPGR